MNFKTLLYIFSFTSFNLIVFGQNEKDTYKTLVSSNSNMKIWECSIDQYFTNKRKLDSLQVVLDRLNLSCSDKEYVYVMHVYTNYSYDLLKEYKFTSIYHTITGEEYRKLPKD